MDNTSKLDKALSHLRQLDLDQALKLMFEILQDTPKDLTLINRIYLLVSKKPQSTAFKKICLHIFKIKSKTPEFHQLIIDSFLDFSQHYDNDFTFNRDELFNLFEHISNSHLTVETDLFIKLIKKNYPEDPEIANYLKHNCQILIQKNKIIKAKEELKYLITFYTETDAGRWALNQMKNIS